MGLRVTPLTARYGAHMPRYRLNADPGPDNVIDLDTARRRRLERELDNALFGGQRPAADSQFAPSPATSTTLTHDMLRRAFEATR